MVLFFELWILSGYIFLKETSMPNIESQDYIVFESRTPVAVFFETKMPVAALFETESTVANMKPHGCIL